MDRKPRQPDQPILSRGLLIWLATTGLVMGVGTLGVLSWAEQARTLVIAHTMGVVTFSLYTLFFSIATKDERRTAFSLDTSPTRPSTSPPASHPDAPAGYRLRALGGIPQDHQPRRPAVAHLHWRGLVDHRGLRNPQSSTAAYRRQGHSGRAVPPVAGGGCLVNAALLRGDKTRHPPAAGITPGRVSTLQGRSNRIWGNRLERGGSRGRSRVTIGQLGVSYEREGSPLRRSPRACRRPVGRGRAASVRFHVG